MYILNEEQIIEIYSMQDAIADVTQTLLAKSANKIEAPFRTVIDFPKEETSILYMPSADLQQQFAAIKVVSIFPNNPQNGLPTTQGIVLLTDSMNGRHLALLNASYLTRLRTGAISALATDSLARRDATALSVIGTGAMAFEQVVGVLAVREITHIYLFNRTIEKAHHFKEQLMAHYPHITIIVTNTVDEAIECGDIINCATRSTVAVFDGNYVKPGTHINGVGSYLPEMREIDELLITSTNKIVVDDLHGVMHEAGEFMHAAEKNQWTFDDVHGTVEQLVANQISGRESEDEITIFKSVGAAFYDLAVAKGVYTKASTQNIGIEVEI